MKEPIKPKNVKVRDQALFAEVKKLMEKKVETRLPDNVILDSAMGALRDKYYRKIDDPAPGAELLGRAPANRLESRHDEAPRTGGGFFDSIRRLSACAPDWRLRAAYF